MVQGVVVMVNIGIDVGFWFGVGVFVISGSVDIGDVGVSVGNGVPVFVLVARKVLVSVGTLLLVGDGLGVDVTTRLTGDVGARVMVNGTKIVTPCTKRVEFPIQFAN